MVTDIATAGDRSHMIVVTRYATVRASTKMLREVFTAGKAMSCFPSLFYPLLPPWKAVTSEVI